MSETSKDWKTPGWHGVRLCPWEKLEASAVQPRETTTLWKEKQTEGFCEWDHSMKTLTSLPMETTLSNTVLELKSENEAGGTHTTKQKKWH